MPYRITLFGNSSVGKSTIIYKMMSEFKEKEILFGYVEDICRRPPFNPEDLDKFIEARYYVLFRQMSNEMLNFARKDMGVILSERSVLDWWIYSKWTREHIEDKDSVKVAETVEGLVENLVFYWAKLYDRIYYVATEDFKYILDGFRPITTMRQDVEPLYEYVYNRLKKMNCNVVYVGGTIQERKEKVLTDALKFLKDKDVYVKRKL